MDFGNNINNNNNFNKINNNKTESMKPTKSIFNFPKIEMAARKEANKKFGNDNWDIEILMSKYIPKSLSENFNQMSEENKNNFFLTLSNNYTNICNTGGEIAELLKVSEKFNDYLKYSSTPKTPNIYSNSSIINAGYDSNIEEGIIDDEIDNISKINEIKQSQLSNKKNNNQLGLEHSQKGDTYFNQKEYEKALSEYKAAYKINKNEISYLIKEIMVKEMFECPYYALLSKLGCTISHFNELELISEALNFCEKNGEYNYLPFLYTLCGDYCRYEDLGIRGSYIFYGLAIDLLNMVPDSEKFAAPYYKLARIKEQFRKNEEALTLFHYTNSIDKSYDTQKDIKRVESAIKDGGKNNLIEANKLIEEMIKCCKSGAFSEVIQKGKIASEYDPDNATIYYLICCAAEIKNDYYDLKWAAKEGIRAYRYNSNQDKKIDELYFYYWLGKCCKFENKQEQASYYFQLISEIDDDIKKVVTKKALNELYLMTCGRKLYEDVN